MSSRLTLTLGSLALALTLAGCGSSSYSPANPTPLPPTGTGSGGTPDVTITINGMNGALSYSPSPASVKAGQSVAWHNADSLVHTATADNGGFDTGTISPGGTSNPIVMSTAGTFGYHCSLHPSMVATLNVTQ